MAYSTSNLRITGCKIQDHYDYGLYLSNCQWVKVDGNDFSNNNYYQIYLSSCSNCTIEANNITNGYTGIRSYYGSLNQIIYNNIINNNDQGIRLRRTNDIIRDNYLKNNQYTGISFDECTGGLITNLTIIGSRYSVNVYDFSDVTIYNSSLGSGRINIYTYSYLTLVNTTFKGTGNGSGIDVYFDDDDSTLTIKWYLKVIVVNDGDNPIAGARVIVKDAFGLETCNGTANSSGICNWILCTQCIQNNTLTIPHSPHNVTGIASFGTGYTKDEPNMIGSKTVKVVIIDKIPPIADAGYDQIVDQHTNVTFNGTGSSDNVKIINFVWSFEYVGKIVELYGPTTFFIFHDAGVYNVTLNVTDGVNWVTDNLTVTVRDITSPIAEAGFDIKIDQFETAIFDASKSSDNVGVSNYLWTFNYDDNEIKLLGPSHKFTFNLAGEFLISLNVSDDLGNWDVDSLMVFVRDIESPIADAGPDQVVDQHENMTFNGTNSHDNVGISKYKWAFTNDGKTIILYGPTPSFMFHTVGKYLVKLVVYDGEENNAEDYMNVTVRDITPPIANAGSDITIYQEDRVYFKGLESSDNVGVINWTWRFEYNNAIVTLYGPTPKFRFDIVGEFLVTLNVTDSAGNWALDNITVFVKDITNPIPNAGFNITVFQNETVVFNGTFSRDNVGIINWTWIIEFNNEKVRLYGPIQSWTFKEPGNYTVTLIVSDAESNKAEDKIWVNVLKNVTKDDDKIDDEIVHPADDEKPADHMSFAVPSIIVGLIILIIIVSVFFFVYRRKKGKTPESDEKPEKVEDQPSTTGGDKLISAGAQTQTTSITPQIQPTSTVAAAPSLLPTPAPTPSAQPQPQVASVPSLPSTTRETQSQVSPAPALPPPSPTPTPIVQSQPITPAYTIIPVLPVAMVCPKCGNMMNAFPDGSSLCPRCGCIVK